MTRRAMRPETHWHGDADDPTTSTPDFTVARIWGGKACIYNGSRIWAISDGSIVIAPPWPKPAMRYTIHGEAILEPGFSDKPSATPAT